MEQQTRFLNLSIIRFFLMVFFLIIPVLSHAYIESFENEIPGSWTTSGNGAWVTTTSSAQDGSTSIQSPAISDSQSSTLQSIRSCAAGDITFYYKTSTEANNDQLQFYIDGQLIDSFSGENEWTQTAYPVTAGVHTFTWTYNKDLNFSEGEDRVWLDLVRFPGERLAAGGYHSAYIHNDGTLWAWGANNYGQLGDGTTIDSAIPVQIGSDDDWAQITAGFQHTLALKLDGTLWAWGANNYGQLGDGTTIDSTIPVQIGSDNDWALTTAGSYYSLAITSVRLTVE